jgi:predicted nucleic acid-binding protein
VTIVPDASVAVEFLLRTAIGESLAPRFKQATLVAPALIDYEIASVLRRLTLRKQIDARRAKMALDILPLWPIRRVNALDLLGEAWSLRHNLSSDDAFYVATARLHRAQLLTADGPLARAPRVGVVIENVRI